MARCNEALEGRDPLTRKDSLSWGIVGCGRVSPNHAWAASCAGLSLRAACDIRAQRAESLAERFGIQKWTSDVHDLVADDDLDVVSVATDHASHVQIARLFLGRKGVVIEKPLGLPGTDYRSFLADVDRSNTVVSVVSQHRLRPHVLRVREAVLNRQFGAIELVRVRTSAHRHDSYYTDSNWRGTLAGEGGSALVNQGYHAIDLIRFLFGVPEVRFARTWTHRTNIMETEEGYQAWLELPAGGCVELFGTNAGTVEWDVVLEVHGSKGHVVLDLNHPGSVRESSVVSLPPETESAVPPPGVSYYGAAHSDTLKDLVDAVAEEREPAVTVREAWSTLQLIQSIYASARDNSLRKGSI